MAKVRFMKPNQLLQVTVEQIEAVAVAARVGRPRARRGVAAFEGRPARALACPRMTDHLATVLAARYAAALAGWSGELMEEFRRELRALRGLCQDIVELRRGDHSGARLKMEQERLEREREKTEAEVVAQFEQWARNPAVRDCICQTWTSPEERAQRLREIYGCGPTPPKTRDEALAEENEEKARRIREIYGLPPEPEEETGGPEAESNPVKPSQTEITPNQCESHAG